MIPPQDYDELRDAGVAAIFGPGTNIPNAARRELVLDLAPPRARVAADDRRDRERSQRD